MKIPEHIHTLVEDLPHSTRMFCEGCDIALRMATYEEAVFVQNTDGYLPDGPMIGHTAGVVVPLDYRIPQEAE